MAWGFRVSLSLESERFSNFPTALHSRVVKTQSIMKMKSTAAKKALTSSVSSVWSTTALLKHGINSSSHLKQTGLIKNVKKKKT